MAPGRTVRHPRTTGADDQPSAAAVALAAVRSAGSNPILQCFPQGAIIAFDRDLEYLTAGGLGLGDVGLSREMLEGKTIFEAFAPEEVTVIEPLYRLALAGEETSFDVPYRGRVFLMRLGPLRAADGQIVGGLGFTQDVTDARRRERELDESETRFRVAFEHAPIAKALIGLDFRYEMVNPAMCAFTGYSELELVGRSMVDIAHPGDIDTDLAAMAGLLADEQVTYSMDMRFRTATGSLVWGTKSATLVRRDDGVPLHFIAQIQDITARKLNEQALLNERRRLRDAESMGRVGSWDLDLGTGSITWSRGLYELWGLDPDGVDDFDAARDQIHPDDLPELDAATQECRNTGAPFRVRYRISRAGDNEQRWIDVRGAAALENGHIVRIGGALADITEQMQAYAEVAEAQAFQQAVIGASPDIIAVWDFTTQSSVWTNRSIPGMLGYNSQDITEMGPSRRNLVFSGDRERFEAALQIAHDATADDVVEVDYRMVQKDGTHRWFAQRSAPIARDERGRVTRIVGIVRDITERRLAEAARLSAENLTRTTALRSQFLSRISHELRTPLNAVVGFGQLLEMDELTGPQQEAVQHILDGGRHLVRLVDDILDITMVDGGRLELAPEAVQIDDLLPQFLQHVASAAAAQGVALHYHPAAPVVVWTDRRRLGQVVTNLLSNAIRYNRPTGRVDLSYALTSEGQLDIVVADTGVGIATQDLPRLFVPFERIDTSAGGTGLGLTLSRDLMTALGGTLRASSIEGIGSTFTASLPLADTSAGRAGLAR